MEEIADQKITERVFWPFSLKNKLSFNVLTKTLTHLVWTSKYVITFKHANFKMSQSFPKKTSNRKMSHTIDTFSKGYHPNNLPFKQPVNSLKFPRYCVLVYSIFLANIALELRMCHQRNEMPNDDISYWKNYLWIIT